MPACSVLCSCNLIWSGGAGGAGIDTATGEVGGGGDHQARVVMETVATLVPPDFVGYPRKLNKENSEYRSGDGVRANLEVIRLTSRVVINF